MGTLDDLEARVAALEADRVDYRAVLSAVNALGANQREMAESQRGMRSDVTGLKADSAGLKIDVGALKSDVAELRTDVAELRTDVAGLTVSITENSTRLRSLEDGMAEVRDLLVRALDT